ncbi:Short chain dehydrogenase [Pleurostoma richardsiae]|uniref:Short chain dehydrogenase n=1 Tax=Pleurostoma richardsiae TaxID=41990 RepID=A0AA38S9L0_9PEZI|nr:Short chain dehydrogenase [Pleurostoma richardsiae]
MASHSKYNKLQGKHVLVIGGSSGIGYAVAEGALASGANVTVSSSRKAKLDASVAALQAGYPSQKVVGAAADLSGADVEDVLEALFKEAESAFNNGQIHHVVYTAADALSLGGLADTTPELIARAGQMRLVAPLMTAKVAARHLEKSASSSLTLTTGSTAEKPAPGWALVTYFAGGLQGLTKALAVDLAPVRVNAVRPGYVNTGLWDPMGEEAKEALLKKVGDRMLTGSVGQPEDVAEAYLWLLKDRNVTGTIASTDSGCFLI